jgi:hypothetical protein
VVVTTGRTSEDEIAFADKPDGPGAAVLDPVVTRLVDAPELAEAPEGLVLVEVTEAPAEVTSPERT